MILTQVISVAVAVLAIVWHQQRSIERLRAEMRSEFAAVRSEIAALRADLNRVRERLARVEGYLHIGVPAELEAAAAGGSQEGMSPGV